jgi:hypothetical protein
VFAASHGGAGAGSGGATGGEDAALLAPSPVAHSVSAPAGDGGSGGGRGDDDDGDGDDPHAALRRIFTVHFPTPEDPLSRPAEILPNVWLGNWASASDVAFLRGAHVVEVVNCAARADVDPAMVSSQQAAGVRHVHFLNIQDVETFDTRAALLIGALRGGEGRGGAVDRRAPPHALTSTSTPATPCSPAPLPHPSYLPPLLPPLPFRTSPLQAPSWWHRRWTRGTRC